MEKHACKITQICVPYLLIFTQALAQIYLQEVLRFKYQLLILISYLKNGVVPRFYRRKYTKWG